MKDYDIQDKYIDIEYLISIIKDKISLFYYKLVRSVKY